MATLRTLEEQGFSITLHCRWEGKRTPWMCVHHWTPTWPQLIQYFGAETELGSNHPSLLRFVCEECGGRGVSLTIHPPASSGTMGGMASHNLSPMPPDEREALRVETKRVEQFIAERKSRVAADKKRKQAEARARKAIETGKDLIGPPNPWPDRKGRWV